MASPFMLAPCPVGSLNHKLRFVGIPFRFNHFVKCSQFGVVEPHITNIHFVFDLLGTWIIHDATFAVT
jgi:hypothetical protein